MMFLSDGRRRLKKKDVHRIFMCNKNKLLFLYKIR